MTAETQPNSGGDGPRVYVEVSGLTGTGKSAIMGEIEIALHALGVPVDHDADFQSEKNMTHADWQTAIDLYKPTVVIRERNVSRASPARGGVMGVPVEPTREMIDAGADYVFAVSGVIFPIAPLWNAMLSAAPSLSPVGGAGSFSPKNEDAPSADEVDVLVHRVVALESEIEILNQEKDFWRSIESKRPPRSRLEKTPYERELYSLWQFAIRQRDVWRGIASAMGYEPMAHGRVKPTQDWLLERIARYRSAVAKEQSTQPEGWRQIETAPKNERILAEVIYDPPHPYLGASRVEVGALYDHGWTGEWIESDWTHVGADGKPVRWMPMPRPLGREGEG